MNSFEIHERKSLTEIMVIKTFSKLKELTNYREQELSNNLNVNYSNHIKSAETEQQNIIRTLQEEIEGYQNFQVILKTEMTLVDKIRKIQALPRSKLAFNQFDGVAETQLRISINPEVSQKLISSTMRICLENPNEHRIRRTHITRALK